MDRGYDEINLERVRRLIRGEPLDRAAARCVRAANRPDAAASGKRERQLGADGPRFGRLTRL